MESLLLPAVIFWGLLSGWVAAWYSHRYRLHTDDEGFESAELSDARCPHCDHTITLAEAMPVRSLRCGSCGHSLTYTWWGTHLAVLATSVVGIWVVGVWAVGVWARRHRVGRPPSRASVERGRRLACRRRRDR